MHSQITGKAQMNNNLFLKNKWMSTLNYQPTHQPNAPDHVSLPRLAPARAVQREEAMARRQRSAHTEEG